jgi:RND superfamily putative drug exporter
MTKPRRNIAARAGRWSAQHRKTAVIGWLVFTFAAFVVGNMLGSQTLEQTELGVGDSGQAEKLVGEAFPEDAQEMVLISSTKLDSRDPAFVARVHGLEKKLAATAGVKDVVGPYDADATNAVSEDGTAVRLGYSLLGDETETAKAVKAPLKVIASAARANRDLVYEPFGEVSSEEEFTALFNSDFAKATTTSLPLTLLILLIAAGTLVAAGVPLLLGITGVIGTMGVVAGLSQISPVAGEINEIILLIGLAVGVDYALFYLRREREERAAGRSKEAALEAAAATSGRAVLISGITVMIAMAGLYLSGDPTFISFATGGIAVVAVSLVGSLTVLPGLLSMLGDRVEKGRIPVIGRIKKRMARYGVWSRIVDRVLRRPLLAAVISGGLLLALAVPALQLHAAEPGIDSLPQDIKAVQTFQHLEKTFPSEGNGSLVVIEAADVTAAPVKTAIAKFQAVTAQRTDVFNGETDVTVSPDRKVAMIGVPMIGEGGTPESDTALLALRDEVVPETLAGAEGVERVLVGGGSAELYDYTENMGSSIFLVVGFVLAAAFLLLLVTFRSVVIPIKAILLNLLSVGAAYGVLVLVFQHGWGDSLLGFEAGEDGSISPWLPLFMFVVLFGLSMDYHVFLLSRVKELYDGGMSTDEAVAEAVKSTSGTITSAAMVMVGVFAVFATLSFLMFKQLGVGLAAAVLIDATIVRAVLLPATMKLLGDRNWWLPKSLSWLPRFSHHEPEVVPAAA